MNKYKKIIFLILSIIVFNIGVVLSSYLISQNINKYTAYEGAISQQQVYLDKMSKDVIDLNTFAERLKGNKDPKVLSEFVEETFGQVQDTDKFYRYLTKSISAFSNGTTLTINNVVYKLPEPAGEAEIIHHRINEIWQPLSALLDKMTKEFNHGKLDELGSNVQFSADYIRKYSEILGGYLDQLKEFYQEKSSVYTLWLKSLQIFAIVFTIIFFGFLTFFGLRSLIFSDRELEKSRQETMDIMKTVKEGLFLIDQDLVISGQYSRQLETILNTSNISGLTLDQLLSSIVSKADFETTKDFIEQLFNEDVIEELIEELNPLDKVKIFIQQEKKVEDKYLSFNFSRVYDGEEITNILISVADITRQVLLEERLEKERVQHDEQIEMLSSILSIPAVTLQSFIRHVNKMCNAINNILKTSGQVRKAKLVEVANSIFREVHAMKGEASALNLRTFVFLAEEMESKISALKNNPQLSGRDFLPLAIDIDRTIELNNKIIDLQQKMNGEQTVERIKLNPNKTEAEMQQLTQLVSDVAKRNRKEVKFLVKGWQYVQQLEEWQQDKLREVIIQLLRNAVVHGIEPAGIREANNKNAIGKVLCEVVENKGQLIINVADDGGGINYQSLQQKAIAAGKLSPDESLEQAKPKLLRYLFDSGVSTAKTNTEDAGRGVGMDVVKVRLQELAAKISVVSESGKMTKFRLQIPI